MLLCAWTWELRKFDDLASVHSAFITARDLTDRGPFCMGEKSPPPQAEKDKMAGR
jgi:hypothetical protein